VGRSPSYLVETAFVKQVAAEIRRASNATPVRLLLTGGRGAGKRSALNDALARRAVVGDVLAIKGNADFMGTAYAPVADAFDDLLNRQRRDQSVRELLVDTLGDVLKLLPFVGTVGGRVKELHTIFGSLERYPVKETSDLVYRIQKIISSLSRRSHVVLVMTDIDRFDSFTLALLSDLIANEQLNCSYVLTRDTFNAPSLEDRTDFLKFCDELALRGGFRTIPAEPFLPVETAAYVCTFLRNPAITLSETAALHHKTGGLPQFLRELLEHLDREGQIVWRNECGVLSPTYEDSTLPENIRKLIDLRLRKLSPELRRVLDIASVLGTEFHHKPISGRLRLEDLEVLERLNTLRLIHNLVEHMLHSGYRFTLAAIRDAVYDTLGPDLAREHHEMLARYFEDQRQSDDDDRVIAFHFERAGRWPEALRYTVNAAHHAESRHLPAEAARCYGRAFDLQLKVNPSDHYAQIELKMKSGMALHDAGNFAAAADQFAALLLDVDDASTRTACTFRLGLAQYMLDQPEIALKTLLPLASEGAQVNTNLLVRLHLTLSSILFHTGRFDEGRVQYKTAFSLAASSRSAKEQIETVKRLNMYFVPELALPQLIESRKSLAEDHDILYWELGHNIGANYMLTGELSRAHEHFWDAYQYFDEIGSYRAAHSLNNLGIVQMVQGHLDRARSYFKQGRTAATTIYERLSADVHLAVVDALTGDATAAEASLRRLRRVAETTTEMVLHEIVTHNLAWVLGLIGRSAEAIEVFQHEIPRRLDLWFPFRDRVRKALIATLQARGALSLNDAVPNKSGSAAAWWFRQTAYEVSDIWFWEW
jgi:tetratricopeptide (TPR) repeat protein